MLHLFHVFSRELQNFHQICAKLQTFPLTLYYMLYISISETVFILNLLSFFFLFYSIFFYIFSIQKRATPDCWKKRNQKCDKLMLNRLLTLCLVNRMSAVWICFKFFLFPSAPVSFGVNVLFNFVFYFFGWKKIDK